MSTTNDENQTQDDDEEEDVNYTKKSRTSYKKRPNYGYENSVDWTNKKHKPYGSTKKDLIFFIYLIALLLWGIIIAYLSPKVELWGFIILAIPFLVFIIGMITIDSLSPAVEDSLFRHNILATGLLIILPLLAFITKDFRGDQVLMIQVVLLAITFSLLSMVDIWIPEKWLSLVQHIKSIFQTFALTLILFSLYLYYSSMEHLPWSRVSEHFKEQLYNQTFDYNTTANFSH